MREGWCVGAGEGVDEECKCERGVRVEGGESGEVATIVRVEGGESGEAPDQSELRQRKESQG